MSIKICIAGATGWAGSALSKGVLKESDITLVAGMSEVMQGVTLRIFLMLQLPKFRFSKISKKLWKAFF